VLRPGEVQRMSAGTGIRHSEFNPSADEPVHLYQIWILPDRAGHEPSYEQTRFDPAEKAGRLRLVASPDGREGSVTIHQDARIYQGDLAEGSSVDYTMSPGRHAWVQVLRGSATLNGQALAEGDGAAVDGESALNLSAEGPSEVLVFDLA
jgi:redox-sensitive bicupin YhaK (pirin superfamily)